jgi:hypothetical protein
MLISQQKFYIFLNQNLNKKNRFNNLAILLLWQVGPQKSIVLSPLPGLENQPDIN